MRKRALYRVIYQAVVFVFLAGFSLNAQGQETLAIGEWRGYFGHGGEPRGALATQERYYMLSSAGFVCYDAGLGSYREYAITEGLSATNPTAIGYAEEQDLVCVGYGDGRIDCFQSPGDWQRIYDIYRNSGIQVKTIRGFAAGGNLLYIATDFGLVGYDLLAEETRFSTRQISSSGADLTVSHVGLYNNRVWALLDDGLYSAPVSGANLADPASWQAEVGLNGLSAVPSQIAATASRLFAVVDMNLLHFDGSSWQTWVSGLGTVHELGSNSTNCWRVMDDLVVLYDATGTLIASYSVSEPRTASFDSESQILVVGDRDEGLLVETYAGGSFSSVFARKPNLPYNGARRITAHNGTVYVAPTGFTGAFKGYLEYVGAFAITPVTNQYTVLSSENGVLSDVRLDFGTVARDPVTGQVWYGSWGDGIIQTDGEKLLQEYTTLNSPLTGLIFNSSTGTCDIVFSGGMAFDAQGNLYISSYASGACSDASCCVSLAVRSPSNEWLNLPRTVPDGWLDIQVSPTTGYIYAVLNPVTSSTLGFVVYDPVGDPFTPANHRQRQFTSTVNAGGLPSSQVFDMAEDRDGALWVGTGDGVAVYYNPFDFFSGNAVNPVLPILDGFPLLNQIPVRAVAVDGGNRKWFGTDRGVFLTNAAGDQVISHFTTQNSPLPSDVIEDIAVDGSTGEVFFATTEGLVGYRSEVTAPAADNQSPQVFPNPVYSDYQGPIAIRGVAEGTVVRLTDPAGRLVKELTAEGGQVIWDGRDRSGQRVQSGVYLAWLALSDGTTGGVAKIAFIRRN